VFLTLLHQLRDRISSTEKKLWECIMDVSN
jgi:hypothetical protein